MKKYLLFFVAILGLWACRGENKQVLAYTINAANDTLSYHLDSTRAVSSVLPKGASSQSDSTYAVIKYPVFQDDSINNYIKLAVRNCIGDNDFETYQDIASKFINDYNETFKEFPESFATWYYEINIQVVRQQFNYLALSVSTDNFTGGAHGSHQLRYINLNPKTRKAITIDSLIATGKIGELNKIAENIFRKNEKISPNEALDQKYFFDQGKFSLPDNFYLSKDALVFLYNIYEIKPYSEGTTELAIPFKDLKNIIKPNSLISANTSL
jgi:hypothetical protein